MSMLTRWFLQVSVEKIYGSLRSISVEKGFDPHKFALVAFGGAGGLAACFLASLAQSYPAIVPPSPGVLCAFGDATTGLRAETSRTFVRPLKAEHLDEVADMCVALLKYVEESLLSQGASAKSMVLECELDLRYHGQATSLSVKVESIEELKASGFAPLAEQYGFHSSTFNN